MIMPKLAIYPNPNSGHIEVLADGFTEHVQMNIFDLAGKVMQSQMLDFSIEPRAFVSLSNISNGIYFVRINSNSGKIASVKMIIHR